MTLLPRRLAETLAAARMNLTEQQIAGRACAHCGRPFNPGETTEPYARRLRQCQVFCAVAAVPGLTGILEARITATRPGRARTFNQLDPHTDTGPLVVLEIRDGAAHGRSAPIPVEYAQRVAQQAGWLGFDADILEQRDEKEDGR